MKVNVERCSGAKGKNKSQLPNYQPQVHSTEVSKNTVDPKWNQHYDLLIGLNDAITISVWNDKKVNKDQKGKKHHRSKTRQFRPTGVKPFLIYIVTNLVSSFDVLVFLYRHFS